ncbi:hypothetical protein [Sorangium cellulosum]|uniref:Uncharacterized protein n=1 Tax=Sorangium cellulosum TaxID=56 RepID=A0A150Q7T3_SORCE|nr:hypothetical protein [Sorangium cellulosum]KYF64034.1 hypothetical protein BE15_34465 [Sorangium cellulosum]
MANDDGGLLVEPYRISMTEHMRQIGRAGGERELADASPRSKGCGALYMPEVLGHDLAEFEPLSG